MAFLSSVTRFLQQKCGVHRRAFQGQNLQNFPARALRALAEHLKLNFDPAGDKRSFGCKNAKKHIIFARTSFVFGSATILVLEGMRENSKSKPNRAY
jgi:hypothetical protein